MWHDLIDIAFAIIVGAIGWGCRRIVGRIDDLESGLGNGLKGHAEEIRDTRQAISRIEGHLELPPFPYTH